MSSNGVDIKAAIGPTAAPAKIILILNLLFVIDESLIPNLL